MRLPLVTALLALTAYVAAADLPLPPPPPLPSSSDSSFTDLPPLPSAASDNFLPPLPNLAGTTSAGMDSFVSDEIANIDDNSVDGEPGTITGGRVHIRAGDNTKYEIIHTADTGMPVRVFEKKGDWVQIAFPTSEACFVEQRVIDGDLPIDIPEQGVARSLKTVAKIFVRSWSGSTVVGELKPGDTVIVTGTRGQFLRIRPPSSARAWVFSKYVKYDSTNVATVEANPEEQTAKKDEELRAAVDNAKATLNPKESRMLSAHKNDPLLAKLRERAEQERAAREQTKNMLANLDQTLAAIDEQTAERINEIYQNRVDDARNDELVRNSIEQNYRPGPPPGSLGNSATGWIEHAGFWRNRPAEYRLVKGREVICYLRSNQFNLADYNGRHVVVNGAVSQTVNGNMVLQVESLRLFDSTTGEQPATANAPMVRYPENAPNYRDDSTPTAPVYPSITRQPIESAPVYRDEQYQPPIYSQPLSGQSRREQMVVPNNELVRDINGNPIVAGYPSVQQNENVVIIEDSTPAGTSYSTYPDSSPTNYPGQVIDITGMPTVGY